ncbi:unnamed protein product [Parnassius mnemosyne]
MNQNFNTAHGILALCALILSTLSVLNGFVVQNAKKLSTSVNTIIFIKITHYLTGIATLFCAAASLCYGFDKRSFRVWIGNDAAIHALMAITWVFTISVSLNFWITSMSRLQHLL